MSRRVGLLVWGVEATLVLFGQNVYGLFDSRGLTEPVPAASAAFPLRPPTFQAFASFCIF